ncbi:MAG: hypothetical protein LBJ16_04040, partial [Holosporaceae bacterium]|nr:hypothetical protein [Holosporaceae bacterium]
MKIRHWHNRNHNADDIFKKIAIIFFCLSFFYIAGAIEQIFDLKTGGVNLKIEYNFADKNDICGSLILGVPDGCKIPKKPTISVQKYENLENFHYDDSGISEKDIDGKYRMDFRISIVDATNENNLLQLKIDCPICEGHSCRIEGVNLAISFSHSWQHKFCMMMFIGFL